MGESSANPDFDSKLRARAKLMKQAMLAVALYCFTVLVLLCYQAITVTSYGRILPIIAGGFIFAAFLQILVIPFYLIGYLFCSLIWKGRWRWILPTFPIICLGLCLLWNAAADRLDPSRIMARMSGVAVPKDAQVNRYENSSCWIESHILIEFTAPPSTLQQWIRDMGFVSTDQTSTEKLGRLSCPGDCAEVTVDWTRGVLTFNYLDV
ncbi:MAG: hypothetical protein MUF31_16340 [Akkermansiaceae bacterium]|jgi:hypothetical protein|nr:hypothetical protein [Akkermansiaceae bacterium]